MSKKTRIIVILIMLFLLLVGTVFTIYPLCSAWYTERHLSNIHTQYQEAIEAEDGSNIARIRAAAETYNQNLFSGKLDPLNPEESGYWEQLNVSGNGIMGYVCIPTLNIELPIYQGTGSDVLAKGAGHMPTSSLPIGGENTHAVITAHSGMATSPMFSDLELLKVGDIFQIEVLGEILTYEVDQILTVLPTQVDATQIQRGEDLATLVTCVPYGVNTHRLLVRGHRVPTPEPDVIAPSEAVDTYVEEESIWRVQYWQSVQIGLCTAGGLLLFVLIILLIFKKKKRKGDEQHHEG